MKEDLKLKEAEREEEKETYYQDQILSLWDLHFEPDLPLEDFDRQSCNREVDHS